MQEGQDEEEPGVAAEAEVEPSLSATVPGQLLGVVFLRLLVEDGGQWLPVDREMGKKCIVH